MKTDLYLVTIDGERHEDHIPIGVFDKHQLSLFLKREIEDYENDIVFQDNKWKSLGEINVIKLTLGVVIPHT